MSTPNVEPAEPSGAARSSQPTAQPKLTPFLKVSIILLAALSLASISLLFIGDFEGKFERVFSTFVLFAVFVIFTAFDTRRERRGEWYAPVALIANTYILGLLLIVIWMTAYDPFLLTLEIFWKSLLVIVVTRLTILCCQMLLWLGEQFPPVVERFGFATSILAVLSAILFTAPVGIESFDLRIPDLYWKIATATLILTALGLAITLLMRWSFGSERRDAARQAGAVGHPQAGLGAAASQAQDPYAGAPRAPRTQQPVPQVDAHGRPLLPWPTFPDGRPLPMRPDGQPDFSVLPPQQRPPQLPPQQQPPR